MNTRIHSLILTIALLLSAFAGCGKSEKKANNRAENSTPPDEIEPDYSWFTFPEETNKLTVYSNGGDLKSVLDPAIRIYKEQYPEVEVDFQIFGQDEYKTSIQAEIPAGRGPDLLLLNTVTVQDVYKTMSTGLFENLDPYFYRDEDISLSDYVSGVMDGGLFRGERLLIPLAYSLPLVLTTRSLLDEIGVSEESLGTHEGFVEAAKRYHERYPDGSLFLDENYLDPLLQNMRALYQAWGMRLIDYEDGSLVMEEERVREYADLLKLFYVPDYVINDKAKAYRSDSQYTFQDSFLLKECLYNDGCRKFSIYMYARALVPEEEGLFALIPPDENGGKTAVMELMAAVPISSPNKLNAWRLLKILLSDEIQSGTDGSAANKPYFWAGQPVRKGSLRAVLDKKRGKGEYLCSTDVFDDYCALWEQATGALCMPSIYQRYIRDELFPYVRGERSWEDAYKRFLNTIELYKDE